MLRTAFALTLIAASRGGAQTAEVAAPAFDVASVKASQGGSAGQRHFASNIQVSPGTVTMRGATLKSAIRWAYKVTEYQVTGPDWLDSAHYEIVAKAAGPAAEDELRLMMQGMLRDRFKLEFHRQSKEMGAYVLSVGKNGLKIHESADEGESKVDINERQFSVSVQRTQVSQLVDLLSNAVRAPVVDMTGLKGRYDVTLNVAKYVGDMATQGRTVESTPFDPQTLITTILQREFGLKLEPKKMVLDVLVVDHAEKAPVEN